MTLPVHTIFSETHKELKDIFLETISVCKDISVHVHECEQKCPTGVYNSQGFREMTSEKIKMVVEQLSAMEWNQPMLYSDCDVQFFGDFKDDILRQLEASKCDMLFQNDYGIECLGFFIVKKTESSLEALRETIERIGEFENDQHAFNMILAKRDHKLKKGFLDGKYWTYGSINGTAWTGQTDFDVSPEILVHHSNWTMGVKKKLELTRLVRKKFNESNGCAFDRTT